MLSPGYRRKTSLEVGLGGHPKELSEPVVFLKITPSHTLSGTRVWGWLPTTVCD